MGLDLLWPFDLGTLIITIHNLDIISLHNVDVGRLRFALMMPPYAHAMPGHTWNNKFPVANKKFYHLTCCHHISNSQRRYVIFSSIGIFSVKYHRLEYTLDTFHRRPKRSHFDGLIKYAFVDIRNELDTNKNRRTFSEWTTYVSRVSSISNRYYSCRQFDLLRRK